MTDTPQNPLPANVSDGPPPPIGPLPAPIKLAAVKWSGVAAEAAWKDSERAKVWVRHALTSDDPMFHRIVEGLPAMFTQLGNRAGVPISLDQANTVLMVKHRDESADLWIDTVPIALNAMAKRSVKAGEPVSYADIGDVIGLDFPGVEIKPDDAVFVLLRVDWRFALYFNFNPDGKFSRPEMVATLGALFRQLRYRHLYEVLGNQRVLETLFKKGWFPFVEIIGPEFRNLSNAIEAGFPFSEVEGDLIAEFGGDRVDRILERWLTKPHFKNKELLLKTAADAYKNDQPVSVIKIILTEIEGVLSEVYFAANGKRAKLETLLQFAGEAAEKKSGAANTLLFPSAFAEYLRVYTYANFDPGAENITAGSRHAVGHGAALPDTYTKARALQALLTLDQFAFYF